MPANAEVPAGTRRPENWLSPCASRARLLYFSRGVGVPLTHTSQSPTLPIDEAQCAYDDGEVVVACAGERVTWRDLRYTTFARLDGRFFDKRWEVNKGHVTEFLFFSMSLSNVFTVLNTLYIVFCMFLLIRSSFVSTVCDVLSTLRAGDHRGSRTVPHRCYCV